MCEPACHFILAQGKPSCPSAAPALSQDSEAAAANSFRPEGKQAEKGGAVETFPKHLIGHQVACAVCCTLPEIRPNCGPHGLTQDESNFVALGDPQLFPSQA